MDREVNWGIVAVSSILARTAIVASMFFNVFCLFIRRENEKGQ